MGIRRAGFEHVKGDHKGERNIKRLFFMSAIHQGGHQLA